MRVQYPKLCIIWPIILSSNVFTASKGPSFYTAPFHKALKSCVSANGLKKNRVGR